jgi:hypothetical protein
MSPVHRWAVLHTVYSAQQIRDQDIQVRQLIPPHEVIFSNGERHDYGRVAGVALGRLGPGGTFCGDSGHRTVNPVRTGKTRDFGPRRPIGEGTQVKRSALVGCSGR